jgi:hypothetical protein
MERFHFAVSKRPGDRPAPVDDAGVLLEDIEAARCFASRLIQKMKKTEAGPFANCVLIVRAGERDVDILPFERKPNSKGRGRIR